MKLYSPVAILYEKDKEPWLWSPYEMLCTEERAKHEFTEFLNNYPEVAVIASWIQELDQESGVMREYGIKYYVNVMGILPRGNFTIEPERRI